MKIYTSKQMRDFDAQAFALGIPGILLMEHAAMELLHHVETQFTMIKKIVVICGKGNNGGDGFAFARLCFQKGYLVHILCNITFDNMSPDEAQNAFIAKQLQIPIYEGEDGATIQDILKDAQIVVDALYGSGLSRDIEGFHRKLISLINQCDAYTIGVDVPSGLYGDTGLIAGCVVKCDATITFGYGKLGLFINEGLQCAGEVKIVDIGIPKQLEENLCDGIEILDKELIRKFLPKRSRNSHKGSYGKALCIGGSASMSGAIAMCIQAALRCGVGTLTCAAPRSVCEQLAQRMDECMYIQLEEENGEVSETAEIKNLTSYDVIAIGNGLGRGLGAKRIVEIVLASRVPCILDADALYLAGKYQLLEKRKSPTVLTPHPKEFSHLNGIEVSETLKNPVVALKTWIKAMPSTCIVLKNATSLIFTSNQRYLNICGNDGLATGGSGDVLCGIICAFMAQNASCVDALASAVYVHACCAEQLVKQGLSTYSILPRDLIAILPQVLTDIINDKKT